jgi:hypothetical protein
MYQPVMQMADHRTTDQKKRRGGLGKKDTNTGRPPSLGAIDLGAPERPVDPGAAIDCKVLRLATPAWRGSP